MMKKLPVLMLLVLARFFSLDRLAKADSQPESTQVKPNNNAPRMVILKPGDPEFLAFDGGMVRFLVSSEDTKGAWSLLEETEPPGSKTPWHRHNYSDQAYYVLEGILTAKVADKTYELPAGSYILIPRGTPHAQGNFGTVPVRMLQMNAPGGFERFLKGRVELLKTMKADSPEFSRKVAELRKTVDSEWSWCVGRAEVDCSRGACELLRPNTACSGRRCAPPLMPGVRLAWRPKRRGIA